MEVLLIDLRLLLPHDRLAQLNVLAISPILEFLNLLSDLDDPSLVLHSPVSGSLDGLEYLDQVVVYLHIFGVQIVFKTEEGLLKFFGAIRFSVDCPMDFGSTRNEVPSVLPQVLPDKVPEDVHGQNVIILGLRKEGVGKQIHTGKRVFKL